MRLQSIEISGFRNFSKVRIELEHDCTIIIGENNAGKTNVLDAIWASLRVNRTIRQGAFDLPDYYLSNSTAMAGDAGPIELTATFAEREEDEWDTQIVTYFSDVIQQSGGSPSLQSLSLRVVSNAPRPGTEEKYEWSFLNSAGVPRTEKDWTELSRLQTLRPFFKLDALRDSTHEFSKRSTFFGPFVSDPTFDDDLRDELIGSLGEINEKVLGAHAAFTVLKDSLNTGHRVVQYDSADAVKIEAVPSRLSDLLANTQVSFQNTAGATLPLERQGSGTQSLSVLSLFRAYVAAKLATQLDALSEPILTIEEPESHLHPCAIRALWPLLDALPGQRVVTTHSGDLLSEVPLRSIRRLSSQSGKAESYKIDLSKFNREEQRQINYRIRATRGELFFARSWLLVEGRTEACFLPEVARTVGLDLISNGVRIVEFSQGGGPAIYIRLAEQLGIRWHCLVDSDKSGTVATASVTKEIAPRNVADFITAMTPHDFEAFMCQHGFAGIYLKHTAPQKAQIIVDPPGTDAYCKQVSEAFIDGHKEVAAMEVATAIAECPLRVPGALVELLRKVTS